ncbi:long-subunit acyl-CoA synthetase (AMP-forming) [Mycobacterium frederiksbergense]|uniref:Long-subunit acyl-CoA synthetase (AMP-forming) n=1 Tax=Mycolicibacterium frederiksbergense TaxID=117567 RepID=A0ABT6L6H1_9MYCO|nr:hypothetical protein [Mycolicibacterium frederiksbergense]MDH6198498.1 long-subunit acyl-CoA synthetase (AMP-forming) [Mycolicibacterium frederiksbergense]
MLSRLRERLGLEQVRWAISGAAPISSATLKFFTGLVKPTSALIGGVVAIGDGKPYNIALIALDAAGVAQYAAARGLPNPEPARRKADRRC